MADISNPIVKYSKSQYNSKIISLEGNITRLKTHLATLEKLKEQVPQFWDDPQAHEYLIKLTSTIAAVRNAMDMAQRTLGGFKGTVEKMTGVEAVTTDQINLINDIVSSLEIYE